MRIARYNRLLPVVLILVVIATAIYAITTWSSDNTANPTGTKALHSSSQLPNQNAMPESLQAQPASSDNLGTGQSNTLQSTQSPGAAPSSPPSTDETPPVYPDCRGVTPGGNQQSMMMCQVP